MRRYSQYVLPVLAGIVLVAATVFLLTFSSATTDTFAGEDRIFNSSESHYVTIYDQNEKLSVKTDAGTVGEILDRAGIEINAADIVEPSLETEVNGDGENFYVNIYRARPAVIVDGAKSAYVMTASYDPKEIAEEAGLAVYDGDEITMVESENFLEVGATTQYQITRNGGRTVTVEEMIPFSEEKTVDYQMAKGESRVSQVGEDGKRVLTYNVNFVDGVEVSRELVSEVVVKEPVARVTVEGGKVSSSVAVSGDCADWVRAAGVAESDVEAALDLIYHESGCRVNAANASGAYGIPQALPGSKMSSAGADWQDNPVTQIRWMAGYVNRYGGWQGARAFWYEHGWY